MSNPPGGTGSDAAGRLRRAIGFARWRMAAVMRAEQLFLRAAPLLGLVAVFLITAWFGWFRSVPDWARLATLALFGLLLLPALWLVLRLPRPAPPAVDARLERQNAIVNQAVAAQDDRVAGKDPFAAALWREHQRRMAATIGPLSAGAPHTDLPARDPYAIRVGIALLLVTAFAYSFSGSAGRIGDAFAPPRPDSAPDLRVDAWITPPPYISKAPVFLTGQGDPGQAPVEAVEGSRITVRIGGAPDAATIAYVDETSGQTVPLSPEAPAETADTPGLPVEATVFTHDPAADGRLSVTAGGETRQWAIRLLPDNPPAVAFAEEPRRAVNGALELEYTLTDDFGVVSAEAVIEPVDKPGPDARPLYEKPVYRLTLPRRNARDGRATSSQDLTEHPLAGQKVRLTLRAADGAGQVGTSETREIRLPGRRFSEPLAAAVVEQRGVLALDANRIGRVFELHDALTIAPEETIPNLTHYLLLQSVRGRLENARGDADLREAIDYMWSVALEMEDGNLSLAARKLRDAQKALADALENGASDEEIARLMDELRQAMQDYLSELARQAPENPDAGQNRTAENMLRQQDLQNMLDQIENLARSGARDQAQQLLSELQRMMNNLQAGRQQRQMQQGGPMRQQMDKLGEMMRRQQKLMDETFGLDQQRQDGAGREDGEEQAPGNQGQAGREGQPNGSIEERLGELGRGQQALRQELEQLQKDLEGLGIRPSDGFGEAGEAMGDAARNLGKGESGNALSDQGRALQALRQGAEDMMNQMMQAMGNQQGEAEGEGPGRDGRRNADGRDPLGRPRATTGPDFGGRVEVPDEIDIQRAREILDAIRKRLGDQLSPEVEKRYLERLLDLQ